MFNLDLICNHSIAITIIRFYYFKPLFVSIVITKNQLKLKKIISARRDDFLFLQFVFVYLKYYFRSALLYPGTKIRLKNFFQISNRSIYQPSDSIKNFKIQNFQICHLILIILFNSVNRTS